MPQEYLFEVQSEQAAAQRGRGQGECWTLGLGLTERDINIFSKKGGFISVCKGAVCCPAQGKKNWRPWPRVAKVISSY